MSSHQPPPPRRRRNTKRDQTRMADFIRRKCFICYSKRDHPTTQLPCCARGDNSNFIHERCLAEIFYRRTVSEFLCPYCRAPLWPYNDGEPSTPPNSHHNSATPFCFHYITFHASRNSNNSASPFPEPTRSSIGHLFYQ